MSIAPTTIHLHDPVVGEALARGGMKLIGIMLWDAEHDCLSFILPDGQDREEWRSLLARYGVSGI